MNTENTINKIGTVAVLGAGNMGNQITESLVRIGGYKVNIMDISLELANKGIAAIDGRLEKYFVAKGKMSTDDKKAVEEVAKGADYVIEAVIENLALKKDIFKKLDEVTRPDVILTSNTSMLNITEMASATRKPEKVAGMHFFNPVAMMKLVEVVKGARTAPETIEVVKAMSIKLGKEPVVCQDFSYGFLANRAYRGLSNEAIQMVWERVASPQDIDKALKLGYNLPMGPLELSDMTGSWGIRASSEEDAIRELGSEKGKLHPMIRMMVRAGYTGGVGKKGMYAFYEEIFSKL
ncbi:MAG: 3-hydroxyacyl-CoA dehydrogenase family protein [Chloroflexi bacterium]|nr:3-hydroxyacyl-CoA dehydrogenase family protein [Chloroflexota bacterium]